MSNLAQLIQECVDAKQGNREFALFRLSDDEWSAEIGNPVSAVMLGESSGEFYGEGLTPEEAVAALLRNVRAGICA
jgi:hypothetical protein